MISLACAWVLPLCWHSFGSNQHLGPPVLKEESVPAIESGASELLRVNIVTKELLQRCRLHLIPGRELQYGQVGVEGLHLGRALDNRNNAEVEVLPRTIAVNTDSFGRNTELHLVQSII